MDAEFVESSLLPSIVVYGFMGIVAGPQGLTIHPCLPAACPEMGLDSILYHAARINVRVREDEIGLSVLDTPATAIELALEGTWRLAGRAEPGSRFTIAAPGDYLFRRGVDMPDTARLKPGMKATQHSPAHGSLRPRPAATPQDCRG